MDKITKFIIFDSIRISLAKILHRVRDNIVHRRIHVGIYIIIEHGRFSTRVKVDHFK